MSAAIAVVQADVFTARAFGGNPAVAVLDADGLDEAAMQRIAGELRAPGTAFVSAATRPDADWRLRMFTPRREVGYSGHTALGGTHALSEAGRAPGARVVFDTAAGLLQVELERDADGCLMWLEPPLPAIRTPAHDVLEVLDAIGLPRAGLANWARPAATADADLLLPVTDLATLRALRPDMSRLGALRTAQHGRGVFCVSRETVDPGSLTHGRFFVPHYGLPEDIVTGSVHSPLAVWLLAAGVLPTTDGRTVFTAEQGDDLGRPGRPRVEVTVRGGQAARVRVGGRAVTVLRGHLTA